MNLTSVASLSLVPDGQFVISTHFLKSAWILVNAKPTGTRSTRFPLSFVLKMALNLRHTKKWAKNKEVITSKPCVLAFFIFPAKAKKPSNYQGFMAYKCFTT